MRLWITSVIALGAAATAFAQTPTITAVQDAASYTSNIARGSVFVVKGSNLSSSGFVQASDPSVTPWSTTLNGVSITLTPVAGGSAVNAYMIYTYNQGGVNQLAALLPSSTKEGDYNVTVTTGSGTSAPFKTTVLTHKFGLITIDSSGSGGVVAQNVVTQTQYDVNRFTTGTLGQYTMSPAHPGEVLILWGTGLGPINGPDNVPPGAVDLRNSVAVQVIVGGVTVTPDYYAGRAPTLPGADQINFTLPSNVQTGCTVPLQVSVAGQLSNATTISIAPLGQNACSSPQFSQSVLSKLDQGGSLVVGNFTLSQIATSMSVPGVGNVNAKIESADGAFSKFSGAQLATVGVLFNPTGACQVFRRTGSQTAIITGLPSANLDAGPISLNGPGIANKALTKDSSNLYSLSIDTVISGLGLPPGFTLPGFSTTPVITQGTYQLAGSGGADVGAFNASVGVGTPLTITSNGGQLPASVNRGSDLTLTWTGGNSNDLVSIIGASGTNVGSQQNPVFDSGVFICTTTAGRGTLTVPSSILQQLPVTPANAGTTINGEGILMVESSTQPVQGNGLFTAPLTAGGNIDQGVFVATFGNLSTTSYQ